VDAPVTVAAYPGDTVTAQPPAGQHNILTLSTNGAIPRQYIIIDGLILDGVLLDSKNATLNGIRIDYVHHIRIQNTEVKNIPQNGISVSTGGFNEFINLRVHDTGSSGYGHGFYISSTDNVLEESRIR
jgi:hypothetical protein